MIITKLVYLLLPIIYIDIFSIPVQQTNSLSLYLSSKKFISLQTKTTTITYNKRLDLRKNYFHSAFHTTIITLFATTTYFGWLHKHIFCDDLVNDKCCLYNSYIFETRVSIHSCFSIICCFSKTSFFKPLFSIPLFLIFSYCKHTFLPLLFL